MKTGRQNIKADRLQDQAGFPFFAKKSLLFGNFALLCEMIFAEDNLPEA
jgi:hypothetical protein